jgi:hypothetical protein
MDLYAAGSRYWCCRLSTFLSNQLIYLYLVVPRLVLRFLFASLRASACSRLALRFVVPILRVCCSCDRCAASLQYLNSNFDQDVSLFCFPSHLPCRALVCEPPLSLLPSCAVQSPVALLCCLFHAVLLVDAHFFAACVCVRCSFFTAEVPRRIHKAAQGAGAGGEGQGRGAQGQGPCCVYLASIVHVLRDGIVALLSACLLHSALSLPAGCFARCLFASGSRGLPPSPPSFTTLRPRFPL